MSAIVRPQAVPAETEMPPGATRRLLDVVVSAAALVLSSPLLLVVWIAIRLTSRGPAVFRQDRVGQGGRLFTLLKFRTMQMQPGGPAVTVPGDARITKVGRFLRKTSLDELPQFVNVLRGDMTLVGARPETPLLAAQYPGESGRVFTFRPGITGPGQLEFRDDDVIPPDVQDLETFYVQEVVPRRTEADLRYLDDPSLAQTVRLIARTCSAMVKPLRSSPASSPRAADGDARRSS
jgi:lipopolysaccharide/colanic/teichoic acid biosynthesis glycosyltransferase